METGAFIDMIFMDQVMPNMTGMEATRIIREMGRHAECVGGGHR
jgi:CheY-like chemotaxis protein